MTWKCSYCRREFEPKGASRLATCERCTSNEAKYGKPAHCELCLLPAAFGRPRCVRCIHSEKKYGAPSTCEQCKQRCAFFTDGEHRAKVDGKHLCWMCTTAYRRAKRKLQATSGKGVRKSKESAAVDGRQTKKRPYDISDAQALLRESSSILSSNLQSRATEASKEGDSHLVFSNLTDEIELLKKQLAGHDVQLLEKEKRIAELKAELYQKDKDHRGKITQLQKHHDSVVEKLQNRFRELQQKVSAQRAGRVKVNRPFRTNEALETHLILSGVGSSVVDKSDNSPREERAEKYLRIGDVQTEGVET